ncbi:MAG TPA: FtsX-like permease family protein [Planctomycetaceae bacterium]
MYKFLLCTRYLRTRYIALASIISVMLGVATMIVVNSVMAGFSSEMRSRIHGILSDMVLEATSMDGTPDVQRQMRTIQAAAGDLIEAMSPTVEVYGILSFRYGGQWISRPVTIIGIEPASKAKVGTLVEHLENYQPVRDEMGRIVHAAERSADEPPDWKLLETFLEYRRMRLQQQRLMHDESEAEEEAEVGRHGKAVDALAKDDKLRNPFEEDDALRTDAQIDDGPLRARVYIGAQLISFQIQDKGDKKPHTVMMVQPGDDVAISTVSVGRPPEGRNFNATVVDIFKSGMSEYDSNLVFMNLEELQRVRGMISPPDDLVNGVRSITSIQIKLKNFNDAKVVADRLQAAFPPGFYQVRTWEQKQGPLLAAVDVEATILNVLLFMIIAVAGFGILAIFFMIVVEKTRDIGILKSLGASSRGVMSIFVSYGLSLGMVGSGVGVVVGLLFVRYINEIEKGLTYITGRKVFDETIYYFPSIPTKVHAATVVWVALGAVAIAILASILPARRAARLHPVQALRHE